MNSTLRSFFSDSALLIRKITSTSATMAKLPSKEVEANTMRSSHSKVNKKISKFADANKDKKFEEVTTTENSKCQRKRDPKKYECQRKRDLEGICQRKPDLEEKYERQRQRMLGMQSYGLVVYERMFSAIKKLQSGQSVEDVQRCYGWSDYSMELVVKTMKCIQEADERDKLEEEKRSQIDSVQKESSDS